MIIQIGRGSFSLPGTIELLHSTVVPFVVADAPNPDLTLTAQPVPALDPPQLQQLFVADRAWSLWQATAGRVWTFHAPDRVLALLEEDNTWPRQAVLKYLPFLSPATMFFDYPLGQLMLMEYLADHQGALLHSCGILVEDRVCLFVGPPNAGKSTTARLWADQGYTVLSDDRVVLQLENHIPWAFGTPWHSSTPCVAPVGAPIQAIFFLHHGPKTVVTPLASGEIIRRLLPEVHLPLWHQERVAAMLEVVDQVINTVPCFDLVFAPTAEVVYDVRELFYS